MMREVPKTYGEKTKDEKPLEVVETEGACRTYWTNSFC